jgi:photosystem II stability/assembly factor-like uncharacterized protein
MVSNGWSRLRLSTLIAAALLAASLIAGMATSIAAQATPDQIAAAVAKLEFRNIGPTIMSGRVSDVAVVESDPAIFYVGTASGGVWKTVNHGTTFEPIFDDQSMASIGDVTVAPSNPNIVWVGAGEPQNRQSSPWGDGVYKSTDAGRTWTHMGLSATHNISRIQIHPRNPDIVYVAAVGRLWGPNPERGVYRTMDGGATWELVLFVDEDTGTIDLAMDPGDPQTLFAAMYQRRRTPWGFNGGGPGSGIHRTLDGGETWTEVTEGLPEGDKGRIGLDIFRGDGNMVFAIVEADKRRPGQGFGGGAGPDAKNGVYRSLDRGDTWEHLSTTNNRPIYYSQIRVDPSDAGRIYLGGANLYKSDDGGQNFTPDAASEVHSDHHALWINPANSDHLILGGDGGVSISWDRSETWRQLYNLPISQFYEIGVDMRDPYHVCGGLQDNGSWCAPSDTWSNQGIRTGDWYNVGYGDGFFTVMHPTEPIMLVESQGGNLARVNLITLESTRMRPVARPLAGAEAEEGAEEGEEEEERSLRWNWDTPVVLSSHDPNTVYIGSNILFKSTDLGMTWEEISPDLSRAIDREELEIMGVRGSEPMMSMNDGQSSYGNLTALAESPLNASVLYAGTDDGNVQVTRDGGGTWTSVTANLSGLPDRTYVTRLMASRFDEATVYAAFDGHRTSDFQPYVYVSRDYGDSWQLIVDGLPEWSVNALAQHPDNPNLLFVGNEIGVYFSIDGGQRWVRLKNNLPTVPVDDIVVHPRDNDLVLGTHGRGIWIMSDITPLEELTPQVLASDAHLFSTRRATSYNSYTPQGWTPGMYEAPNPPAGAYVRYYLGTPLAAEDGEEGPAKAKLTILDADGELIRELDGPGDAGIHQVIWNLRLEPPYEVEEQPQGGGGFFGGGPRGPRVLPGTYTVRLEAAGQSLETPVEVRLDPRVEISQADLLARQEAMMSAYQLAKPVYEAGQAIQRLTDQLGDIQGLLKETESAPEELIEEVNALREQVRELNSKMGDVRRGSRGSFSIEGSSTRPTADQLWQLEQAWEQAPGLIEQVNQIVTERMPEIYAQLDEHGIRPDPGKAVEVPVRPGG